MCTSSLGTAMARDRAEAVICNRYAVVCFLPKTCRDLHCVSCNLTAELDENIHLLEGQTLTLGEIRNYEELAINKWGKKPQSQREETAGNIILHIKVLLEIRGQKRHSIQ